MNRRLSTLVAICLTAGVMLGCNLPIWTAPAAPEPVPSSTPAALTTPSSESSNGSLLVFLVKTEDNGQVGTPVGCGDSLVSIESPALVGDNRLVSAYAALLALRGERVGSQGFYNALHASQLSIQSAQIDADGTARVNLEGTLSLGGECDSPRVKAQLEATARQFPEVKDVQITLNGTALDEVLSGK